MPFGCEPNGAVANLFPYDEMTAIYAADRWRGSGRDGDDGLGDALLKVLVRRLLHLLEHEGSDLGAGRGADGALNVRHHNPDQP